MRRPPTALPAALFVLVALVACGGDKKKAAPTPTSSTAPPATTGTTTAPLPGDAAPLTGLSTPDAQRSRPALVVKIDNAPKARPQAGLVKADVVVVEKVEDGVTRLFAVFHSQDSDPVGPVRSARSTDLTLAASLNRPLFAYSGTNAAFQKLVSSAPLVDVGVDRAGGDYSRRRDRPAPYNLFSNTSALFRRAQPGAGPPPAWFTFRPQGQPLAAAGAAPAAKLHVEYRGIHINTIMDYAWDAGAGGWRRSQDGTPHNDLAGGQATPRNVIVQFVEYHDTGQRDRSNTAVPEANLIGSGEAWVLTDGKVVKGRWERPNAETPTRFVDGSGAPVALTPGQTWVELPIANHATVS